MREMLYETARATRVGNRANNQDRCTLVESIDSIVICLADGMGGHPKGEVAAQILTDTCEQMFNDARKPIPDPAAFLEQLLRQAHKKIVAWGNRQKPSIEPRTTAVIALIQENKAHWIHAGDSRLYLFRHGKLLTRTTDHSYVELLHQQGALSADELSTHPYRNYVTRCLGGKMPTMDFSLGEPIALQPDDTLLLCSDGLWGPMNDDELTRYIQADQPLSDIIEHLVNEAEITAFPESDNITAIALRWLKNVAPKLEHGRGGKSNTPMTTVEPQDEDTKLAKAVDHLKKTIKSFETKND